MIPAQSHIIHATSNFLQLDSFLKSRITGSKSRSILGVIWLSFIIDNVAKFCCIFFPFTQKVLTEPLTLQALFWGLEKEH